MAGLTYARLIRHALQPGYDHASEFSYGPDLILDALEARRM
ncbi:hypothetical protein [Rhodococcus sp. AG1013]|nr:hypothetical protein [Rhodococcus sp. AG1013]